METDEVGRTPRNHPSHGAYPTGFFSICDRLRPCTCVAVGSQVPIGIESTARLLRLITTTRANPGDRFKIRRTYSEDACAGRRGLRGPVEAGCSNLRASRS